MIVYFLLIFSLLLIIILPFPKIKIINYRFNIKIPIIFIIIFLFSGLRYGVGTDYFLYSNQFYKANIVPFKYYDMEYGIYFLNNFLGNLGFEDISMFLVTSFFTLILIYRAILKESINVYLSILLLILLGYYHMSFNLIRQFMAIAIFINSTRYIINNNKIKYIISCIMGLLLHSSYIVLIPCYLLRISKKKYWFYYIVGSVSLLGTIGYSFIWNNIVPVISPFYFNKYSESIFSSDGGTGTITFIIYLIIFVLSLLNYKKLLKINHKNYLYIDLIFLGLCLLCLGFRSSLFTRLALYLNISIVFLLPSFGYIYKKITIKLMFISILLVYYIYILNDGGVIPYQIILNH